MMVGHTHEDIDAMFKLIVDLWKRWGAVHSPEEFMNMLEAAISGMPALCHACIFPTFLHLDVHLACISPASRLYHFCNSPVSRLHLACIISAPRLYHACI